MRPWPVVRSVLIGIVLLAQWVDALPLPELHERDLAHPIAQDEIKRWTGVLNDLGAQTTTEDVTVVGLKIGAAATTFRRTTMAPIRPIKRWTGTGQSWGLFAYPDPYAGRLVVAGRTGTQEWQTLFSAPGSGRDAFSRRLRYRRVRGIYDDNGDRPTPGNLYNRFADWVAWEVFQAHPEFDTVQVRLDLMRIIPPGEGERPPDKRRHVRNRKRDALTEKLNARWNGE